MEESGQSSRTHTERDLDYLLFKRRRFRSAKACYPCRRRKVKCDLSQPCDSCNVRGHADLCEYPQSRIGPEPAEDRTKHGHQGHPFHASQAETANTNSVRGLYVDAVEPYESKVHLGSSSLPKLLTKYQNLNQSKRHDGPQAASFVPGAHPQAIFEILCLQDSSPNFPFTNLWKPDDGPEKIYLALPDDDDIVSLVRFCQGSLFRILPSVVNFPEFEATLAHFLETRANSTGNASAMFSPNTSPAWFGLLFAILACGGQLAYEADTEILKARVFACCSFQCLRLSNFISFPTIEVIQTLVLLVNFLRNQADAGASWSMLGLTIRLAQSLGLHRVPNPDAITDSNKAEATVKYYIWRSLIWQDTLVSLCYDRPPGITVLETVPFLPPAIPGDDHLYTFSDSCHYLFMTANKIVQALDYAKSSQQLLPPETILDYRRALNAIESRSVPHVQDISKCQSRDDCIQHYFFRTFSDSVMLCLCRPAVLALDGQRQDELTDIYLSRCRSVLQTYLELLKLQCPIRKSWLFVHITLSCALIFGMATKRQSNPRDEVFLIQFFNTLSQTSICTGVPAYQTAFDRLKKLLDGCE